MWERAWARPAAGDPMWERLTPAEHMAAILAQRVAAEDAMPPEERRLEAELRAALAPGGFDPILAELDMLEATQGGWGQP